MASPEGESKLLFCSQNVSACADAICLTCSVAFVTLPSPALADMAAKNLPGQFDKSHALTAIPLVGASEVLETPEEFAGIENEDASYEPKEHLKGWQTDAQSRDQILTIQGDEVKIDWVYKGANLETNHSRQVCVTVYILASFLLR